MIMPIASQNCHVPEMRRLLGVLAYGGALTTVELWELIDYLSHLSARPPQMARTVKLPEIPAADPPQSSSD